MLLEGLWKLKKRNSSGLEPATIQLGAYCLNQQCYRVPPIILMPEKYNFRLENAVFAYPTF
jgi:hypothetical protein